MNLQLLPNTKQIPQIPNQILRTRYERLINVQIEIGGCGQFEHSLEPGLEGVEFFLSGEHEFVFLQHWCAPDCHKEDFVFFFVGLYPLLHLHLHLHFLHWYWY